VVRLDLLRWILAVALGRDWCTCACIFVVLARICVSEWYRVAVTQVAGGAWQASRCNVYTDSETNGVG
jgi:hypothetical protein